MKYKINEPIRIRYLSVNKESGLTDLVLTPTNPAGEDKSQIILSEIGNGLYESIFTPDVIGWWSIRVSSISSSDNVYSKNYFVAKEYDYVVADFYPVGIPDLTVGDIESLRVDTAGNLMTRGAVLTDEGSFRDAFVGTSLLPDWNSVIGDGASIVVDSGKCTINAGTIADSETYMQVPLDYLPIRASILFDISQRIENQIIYFEFVNRESPDLDTQFAKFYFNQLNDTKICCAVQIDSSTGNNEGIENYIAIPNNLISKDQLQIFITLLGEKVTFTLDRKSVV